jgi:hypothetical protein
MGTGSLEVKRPGREADNSPPAIAEVKKIWIYTSTPNSWKFFFEEKQINNFPVGMY